MQCNSISFPSDMTTRMKEKPYRIPGSTVYSSSHHVIIALYRSSSFCVSLSSKCHLLPPSFQKKSGRGIRLFNVHLLLHLSCFYDLIVEFYSSTSFVYPSFVLPIRASEAEVTCESFIFPNFARSSSHTFCLSGHIYRTSNFDHLPFLAP